MSLDQQLTEAARHVADRVAVPEVDLDVVRSRARRSRRQSVSAVVLAAVVALILGAMLVDDRIMGGPDPVQPVQPPRSVDVVWAAEPGTTSTRVSDTEGPGGLRLTLPVEGELTKDPRAEPLPAWSAFDQQTGRFLWTEATRPDVSYGGPRTLIVSSPGTDLEPAQISCSGLCENVMSFGPAPDEVTVLTADTEKDPVNGGPASLALVYGLDGSFRYDIDLAEVVGSQRRVSAETNDWIPSDGSEALIADIEWTPDGTRLAVSTHPGFFEPDCPPATQPCEAKVWTFDRDGGDPVLVHRQPAYEEQRAWHTPTLSHLAWTSDGSRLGMVLASDDQDRAEWPPRLVELDVESRSASTLHEFGDCGDCRPAPYGFTWSPDGTRLAVTSGDGIRLLNSDGTVLSDSANDGGPGPLAWLAETQ